MPEAILALKSCTRCGQSKPINGFRGSRSECIACLNQRCRDYYKRNREKLLADKRAEYAVKTQELLEKNRRYYEANKARILTWHSEYRKTNRKQCNEWSTEWQRRQLVENPLFQLQRNVRSLIRGKIRAGGYTKRSKTAEILGCDWQSFKTHIERQFTSGMSWEIFGKQIHLDHIIPMASAKSEEDVIRLNHYSNLRPMWADENLRKGAKLNWSPDQT